MTLEQWIGVLFESTLALAMALMTIVMVTEFPNYIKLLAVFPFMGFIILTLCAIEIARNP